MTAIEGYIDLQVNGYAGTDFNDPFEAGEGDVRLFTLAPESDPGGKVTRFLTDHGVRVAAGHTAASLDELKDCIEQGLTLFCGPGSR